MWFWKISFHSIFFDFILNVILREWQALSQYLLNETVIFRKTGKHKGWHSKGRKFSEHKYSDTDSLGKKSSSRNKYYVQKVSILKLAICNLSNQNNSNALLLRDEQFQQKHNFESPEQVFIMELHEQWIPKKHWSNSLYSRLIFIRALFRLL